MAETTSTVYYKRERFLTHLPVNRLYTRSHSWLFEVSSGVWRVGLTQFASRMLGDVVEFGFKAEASSAVALGQAIGWIEGFKAMSEIYCVSAGEFLRGNPALDADITLLDTRPYADGWLYEVRGVPDPDSVDVAGYVAVLDATIDKMVESRYERGEHV